VALSLKVNIKQIIQRRYKLINMPTKQLDKQGFTEKIFDYENDSEWKYKGELPAIIDFYADWCGPCKSVAPVLEQPAEEDDQKSEIYKIDTDKQTELSELFGIQSIPTFLFIPIEGAPMVQRGALPKNMFKQIINNRLLTKTEKEN